MTIGSLDFLDGTVKKSRFNLKKRHVILAIIIVVVIALFLAGYFSGIFHKKLSSYTSPLTRPPPSPSKLRNFKESAICSDSGVCAQVGKGILEINGTAVDAAIASLFCNGVTVMQSMGLGGGFMMTLYKKNEGKAYFLNAREKAPLAAKPELYKSENDTLAGGLAIAVPGELQGYYTLHKKFGTLPWRDLVQPAIDICNNGYTMSAHQYNAIMKNVNFNKTDPNFKLWFLDNKGRFKKQGSTIVPKKLCETLALVAEDPLSLYNGTLSKMYLDDIKEAGGIITDKDLESYEAEWMEPVSIKLSSQDTVYTSPPPGSGSILALILNILDGYNLNETSIVDDNSTVLTYHRIIEAFKFAYAKRTELGDGKFVENMDRIIANFTSREYASDLRNLIRDNTTYQESSHYGAIFYAKEDHGTSHMSFIDRHGDAISVTSSINFFFGNGQTSKQTGLIFNDVMDDFSFNFVNQFDLPGSPNNKMQPGKRPLSSMTPTIVVDRNGDVKVAIGASGGTTITSGVAWALIRTLWFGEDIKQAIDSRRIHHQLLPMSVTYESNNTKPIVDGLQHLGHVLVRKDVFSMLCGIKRQDGALTANADFRKGGDAFGI